MTNSYVVSMIRQGAPVLSIVQSIKAAPEADFLVNSYEAKLLTETGINGREVDQILDAMRWRMSHRPGALPANLIRGLDPAKPTPPADVPPIVHSRIVLEDATPIRLRIKQNLSSADAKTGDLINFEVLDEIQVSNRIVIEKGAIALGTVTDAEQKRRMARGGKLDVSLDTVRLLDGEKVALRGVRQLNGGGHMGGMTAGIIVTGLVVWPTAPLFLLMQGKDVTIPEGTEITAFTNGDISLDSARFPWDPFSNNPPPPPTPDSNTPTSSRAPTANPSPATVPAPPVTQPEPPPQIDPNLPPSPNKKRVFVGESNTFYASSFNIASASSFATNLFAKSNAHGFGFSSVGMQKLAINIMRAIHDNCSNLDVTDDLNTADYFLRMDRDAPLAPAKMAIFDRTRTMIFVTSTHSISKDVKRFCLGH